MEEEKGTPTSTEVEVEETSSSPDTTVESTDDEGAQVEQVDWEAKARKAEELANNYKTRAEKAEKRAKEAPTTEGLNQDDIIFLAKTDIHDDDVADVTKWAKNNGMSVKEAYQQFKPVLDNRAEERKTAAVTSTKSARGVKPTSGEDLLNKAEQYGDVPQDEEGIKKLINARIARRKGQ